jgi:ABC-2 type transport system permease protein
LELNGPLVKRPGCTVIFELIRFELVRRMKMLSTYIFAALNFAMGLFLMLAATGFFKSVSTSSGNERVFANSPHSLFANINALSLLALFTVAAVFGQAASQDFVSNTWMLIFTKNIRKSHYLIGRFLGAYIFSFALFLFLGLGLFAGSVVARVVDASLLGPDSLSAYVWPYLVGVLPMLLLTGALFFMLAGLTKQMAPVYVGMVVLVLGYTALSSALSSVDHMTAGAVGDPLGFLAFDVATRYWTPAERNVQLLPLSGIFLANRALWTGFGILILGFTIFRFRATVTEQRGPTTSSEPLVVSINALSARSVLKPHWLGTAFSGAWISFRTILRSPLYWSFAAAGAMLMLIVVLTSKGFLGAISLPVTSIIIELAQNSFGLFLIICITFYSGELVWSERELNVADVVDATKVPTWVLFTSKFLALCLVTLSFQGVIALVTLITQLSRGYLHLEPSVYFSQLVLIGFFRQLPLCALALTLHILVNQKYLTHGLMVLYFVSNIVLQQVGVEDRLLQFGREPNIPYSDMNHYGHWVGALLTWRSYWLSASVLLLVFGYLYFVRGRVQKRGPLAKVRFRRTPVLIAASSGALFFGFGAYLTFQTHIKNPFFTSKDNQKTRAAYETQYKSQWAPAAQPKITRVSLVADIFPSAFPPRAVVKGTYQLTNKTDRLVEKIWVGVDTSYKLKTLSVGEVTVAQAVDLRQGQYTFVLPNPLQPQDTVPLQFELEVTSDPFRHGASRLGVLNNGTFLDNTGFPRIGYLEDNELSQDSDRKSYALAPKERVRPREDPIGRARSYISSDADFIEFEATISTDEDQIALAPGTVEKEWIESGRRFTNVKMDQPILNFYSLLSARYQVKKELVNGVSLEIYYDQAHPYNIDEMMDGLKDALAYCSEHFGAYQHHQARIIEFPRYAEFAQSFPNTIPFSEGLGFITAVNKKDPEDIDLPYYVTAHEIAHQWWAHQVVGAATRGATLTSESMAQYTALMVLKHKLGQEKMRKFLKHELDTYLIGRITETKKELPLGQNENQQYIHYQKGSLAIYWLQEVIGEDRVNQALKSYVAEVKFKGPPYTTAKELIDHLRAVTPKENLPLIDDLFEKIIIFDNRTVSATAKENPTGGFDVVMKVKAVKYESDENGNQNELDFNETMQIGALDTNGDALHIEKRIIAKGESTISFHMEKKPVKVGLDPINLLIDRTSDDNTVAPSFN